MRVSVRVKPGASRTKVGGQYGQVSSGHGPVLIVFVAQRAVDGAATEGVLKAVAKAFGLRRADVELASAGSGRTSRTKVLELRGDEQGLAARLSELLGS
jgi:uncharacterized protein YggU (UPF0235/DUF167 family)